MKSLVLIQVQLEDFTAARKEVGPSAMREISLVVPSVSWADVGGLDEIKDRLKESVLWPQEKAQDLRSMGVTVRLALCSSTYVWKLKTMFWLPRKGSADEVSLVKF